MMGVQMADENFLVIIRREPEGLLEKIFILGFLPSQQRHAGEKRGSPASDFEETLLVFKVISIERPRRRPRFIHQPRDVAMRFGDA